MAKKKARGPRGGAKHQPGRGHDRKSAPERKKRFAEKARRKRQDQEELAKKQWELWDRLTDDQKRLRPDLEPQFPRPHDGNQDADAQEIPQRLG
jgi:hypothetical protein